MTVLPEHLFSHFCYDENATQSAFRLTGCWAIRTQGGVPRKYFPTVAQEIPPTCDRNDFTTRIIVRQRQRRIKLGQLTLPHVPCGGISPPEIPEMAAPVRVVYASATALRATLP